MKKLNTFLNTAFYIRVPETKTFVFYLDLEDTLQNSQGLEKELKLIAKKKEITCEKLILKKNNQNILMDTLMNNLYSKYLELANSNLDSFKNNIKNNFLFKWIKGNHDFLIENDIQLLRLILNCINNISVNSRNSNDKFIVIGNNMSKVLLKSKYFVYEKSKENNTIVPIGNVDNLKFFINSSIQDNTILIGSYTQDASNGGTVIIQKEINIMKDEIEWIGNIDSISPKSVHMFEVVNVIFENDLPMIKKTIYKIFKKLKWIK